MMKISLESQDGLDWERRLFDIVPRWTREPSIPAIESVCRKQLSISPSDPCSITFYAAGVFNKLYRVDYGNQSLLIRVSLPVHPHHKTRGEVATLNWVRNNTTAMVPRVIAFDDSNNNEIGFEWIMMELMPGSPAYQRWRTMSMKQKVAFTEHIAEIQAELFCFGKQNLTFRNVGTLHTSLCIGKAELAPAVAPGQMISHEFFMDNRLKYHVPRGPFCSSYDWLESQLNINILEQLAAIEEAKDEDDREDAEERLVPLRRLLSLLPKVFTRTNEGYAEPTVLWHDDLNLHNILVDDNGEITAIVDWECVSALPLWMTADMPRYLKEESRQEEPIPDNYAETPEESLASQNCDDPDELDNEGKIPLYWIHRMEYEATQLREVYKTRLRQLWPEWPLQESDVKLDFYEATLQCSAGVFLKMVNRWVDHIERGDMIRLADALYPNPVVAAP
ncbi:phosphotransferase enzyme family-domain-containing protein [Xylaria scruposa]|nr:phosphotransferase enzyme family-domain-containing protein [Xylaria scruposa]